MPACAQFGCAGAIEDGYCNVCGKAAGPRRAASASATSTATSTSTSTSTSTATANANSDGPACAQAGCAGTLEDGYCNVCGKAGPKGASGRVDASPSTRTGSGRTPSTRSSRSTRSTRSGSTRTGRATTRQLGGRPLARPALPPMDPLAAIVPGVVPERKRFCSGCDTPLKRDTGFCPKCGQEYSFLPTLKPGDVVAEKYEIKGTIAFGGLGWIYLALDTVLNRWVILKGLLNSKDPRMLEVAVQEREYLAAVKHPNVVAIYDFVTRGAEGFIVMECVNGKTLMTLRKEANGPLPVAEAISYIIEILPALAYLDEMGLVYCDFKPENVMVEEETVKLIDLGAVRRADDTGGDIYGSKGYTAPEARSAPTPVSDLFSVGRALAVLVASFDFQGQYEFALPDPFACEVFVKNEALYRFLLKATRPKPEERFQTAGEMAEQLVGVLREIVGETEELGHIESSLFDPDSDSTIDSAGTQGDGIPRLKIDKDDGAAGVIFVAGAVHDHDRRVAFFERALKTHPASIELQLRLIDELVSLRRFQEAEARFEAVQKDHPSDWRLKWYRAKVQLAEGKPHEAVSTFQGVVGELPGELGPKQALGRAYEASLDLDRAVGCYDIVSRADPTFVSAALGLARCLEAKDDLQGAASALRRVPSTSNRYAFAQTALARLLIRREGPSAPPPDRILQAAAAIESLDGGEGGLGFHALRAEVLTGAFECARVHVPPVGEHVLGVPFRVADLRAAAERELRTCGRLADGDEEKVRFIDKANQVRPMTLF
jgi:serine/threonine-protein kinase PknG